MLEPFKVSQTLGAKSPVSLPIRVYPVKTHDEGLEALLEDPLFHVSCIFRTMRSTPIAGFPSFPMREIRS